MLFKKFGYGLFKLIYGKIKDFEAAKDNSSSQVKLSKINNSYKYQVYFTNNSRLYTDTINDTAIIQNNKILQGPSFQIRNTKFENIKENIVFEKGTPRLKKKFKGKVLSLLTGGAGNRNYFHWLFDVLPRIEIVKNIINLNDIDFFLIPNLSYKFQRETLDLINIPSNKRISSLKNRHIECDQIIVSDHPYVIKNNASKEIQDIPIWILSWLRKTLSKDINLKDNNFPDKVYLDRSDASPNIKKLRKIINEEEVVAELKEKNFKIIQLSNYSFLDQMKIFYNVKTLVGLHGAGFANVIFSQKDLRVLEIKPIGAAKMIENLVKKCEVNYNSMSITPEQHHSDNQMGHVRVDINELKEKLNK